VIARNILTKPPSAELRENQKDQDSLPPYEVLDATLEGLVEKGMRVADVVALGHDLEKNREAFFFLPNTSGASRLRASR
jgi:NAD+ synthase